MSILFVLLMFLLVMSISYLRTRNEVTVRPEVWAGPQAPRMQREYGFSIPQGFSFHPGHTWLHKEGGESARVGIDGFAANLLGQIDHVEVAGINRWVRQGQKLVTVASGGQRFELVSPVEGVITAVNQDVVEDPKVIGRDPYQAGWIAIVKSPELAKEPGAGRHGRALAAEQRDSIEQHGRAVSADDGGRWGLAHDGSAHAGYAGSTREAGEGILSGVGLGILLAAWEDDSRFGQSGRASAGTRIGR